MPQVIIQGRSIAYEVQPESFDSGDLAIIFIHGTGGDRHDWRHQLHAPLSSRYTVIALELPGHGLSDKPGETDVESYARWTESFVESLGLDKVVLVGCSLGSAITQTLALNPKPWLKAIGLVGAGARLRVMPELLKALLEEPGKALADLAGYCLSASSSEQLKIEIRKKFLNSDPALIHGDLSACDGFDVIKQIGAVSIPTLIVVGRDDRLTPVKYSKFLNESIHGSEMVVIGDAGHLVMMEQPQAFNGALETFVETIK